jgi:hypothetical protein
MSQPHDTVGQGLAVPQGCKMQNGGCGCGSIPSLQQQANSTLHSRLAWQHAKKHADYMLAES